MPVLDLAFGRAVHARGGNRARYRPVVSALLPALAGDARALARAYVEVVGARSCYAADLDAIGGGPVQQELLSALATIVPILWVDAAATEPDRARELVTAGAGIVVAGLETLQRVDDLTAIVGAVGRDRLAFSLDLRDGRPMLHPAAGTPLTAPSPEAIAMAATAAGAGTIIVLDVGRVGSGQGADLRLLELLRRRLPDTRLASGGGVSGPEDLVRLADVGCDAALVASALHDGRLSPRDVAEVAARLRAQSATSVSR